MGRHPLGDNESFVEVIAGDYKGTKGPASTFTPMEVYNLRLKGNAEASLNFPAQYNTGLLVIEGNAEINEKTVGTDHFVLFKNEGESIVVRAADNAVILVLSGEPIDEPIAAYGPFLMNTWAEVEQAIQDANSGKFGVLSE